MAKPKLTNKDFCRAAKRLQCEVAAIKAVAAVESKGEGFYSDGFPVILFERHKFRKFTGGRYNESHPQISGPAGGYGSAGQNQKNKFNLAFKLDPEAAMKSCSWGKFQIMGFNHRAAGFATVGEFVEAMKESEGRQLDAFVNFIIHEHLADELRRLDWSGFAQGYNGEGYKINKYDSKMAAEYKRFSKEAIDCSQILAAASSETPTLSEPVLRSETQTPNPSAEQPPITEQKTTEVIATDVGSVAQETTVTQPKGDPPEADATKVTENGFISRMLGAVGGVGAVGAAVLAYIQSNPSAVAIGLICATLIILALLDRWKKTDVARMHIAADPDKKNVT